MNFISRITENEVILQGARDWAHEMWAEIIHYSYGDFIGAHIAKSKESRDRLRGVAIKNLDTLIDAGFKSYEKNVLDPLARAAVKQQRIKNGYLGAVRLRGEKDEAEVKGVKRSLRTDELRRNFKSYARRVMMENARETAKLYARIDRTNNTPRVRIAKNVAWNLGIESLRIQVFGFKRRIFNDDIKLAAVGLGLDDFLPNTKGKAAKIPIFSSSPVPFMKVETPGLGTKVPFSSDTTGYTSYVDAGWEDDQIQAASDYTAAFIKDLVQEIGGFTADEMANLPLGLLEGAVRQIIGPAGGKGVVGRAFAYWKFKLMLRVGINVASETTGIDFRKFLYETLPEFFRLERSPGREYSGEERAAFREAIQSIFAHLRPLKDDPDSVAVSQVHGLHLDWLIFGTYHAAGDIKGKLKKSRLGKLYSRSRLGRIIGVAERLWDKFVGVEKLPNRPGQPLPGMTWIKPPPPKRWQQALRGVGPIMAVLQFVKPVGYMIGYHSTLGDVQSDDYLVKLARILGKKGTLASQKYYRAELDALIREKIKPQDPTEAQELQIAQGFPLTKEDEELLWLKARYPLDMEERREVEELVEKTRQELIERYEEKVKKYLEKEKKEAWEKRREKKKKRKIEARKKAIEDLIDPAIYYDSQNLAALILGGETGEIEAEEFLKQFELNGAMVKDLINKTVTVMRTNAQDDLVQAEADENSRWRSLEQIEAGNRYIDIQRRFEDDERDDSWWDENDELWDGSSGGGGGDDDDDELFVGQYTYIAVIDERTTQRCRSLHQKTFVYGGGPLPPQHYNCRSEIVPLLQTEKENAEMKEGLNIGYKTWLKNLQHDVRREILGKEENKLFEKGEYNPPAVWKSKRRYYTDQGTLDERKYAETLNRRLQDLIVDFDPDYLSKWGRLPID